nr:hypothetical protein [uncultured Duganella sp.]
MNRRIDHNMAEKVSLALLTKAAFGRDAGLRYSKLAGVPITLALEVFGRGRDAQRNELLQLGGQRDRRQTVRGER